MSNAETEKFIIDIAKQFLEFTFEFAVNWDEAFLRFSGNEDHNRLKCIYRSGNEATFFGFDKTSLSEFLDSVGELFIELQKEITAQQGKEFCVCLLSVNSECDYHFYYEYEDTEKWKISKMDGQSGIPQIDKTE